jgi:aspartyl-tRNA(Asn)/glutamyl-tRNA(Gln) amidotransferase subunit A
MIDLHDQRLKIRSGETTATLQMQQCLRIAASSVCDAAFRSVNPQAITDAESADPNAPLAGLAISIKDLFDIAGEVTTSSSLVLQHRPAASQDCTAVKRLKAAGGVVIGRTHMTELAFSGMGVNPHFGTPVNPAALAVDPATPRIPGGSSSGAAVSVATGAAWLGLGSDTGGSIRIPAAACGLVGFKPTARLMPMDGVCSLSYSMDSIGAITRSVRDARLAHQILAGETIDLAAKKPLAQYRLAVATSLMLDQLDQQNASNFARSLAILRKAGAQIVDIALDELLELPGIQARGGFSACELQSWLIPAGLWPPSGHGQYDPRVAQRIATANTMSAADYVRLQRARADWIARMQLRLQAFDAVLSPTTPIVATPLADVAPGTERDAEFFRVNALMLRNALPVNFLDGCAISVPNHQPGELPTGLMIWHSALRDRQILDLAAMVEPVLRAEIVN